MAGINVGTLVAKTLKVGTTQVQKMYLGASKIWENWSYGTTQLDTTATHNQGWNELRWIESINYFPAIRRQITFTGYAYVWDSSESHEYIYFRRVSDGVWVLHKQIDTGYYGSGQSGWWDMSGSTDTTTEYDAIKVVTYSKNFSHYTQCSATITSYYQKG